MCLFVGWLVGWMCHLAGWHDIGAAISERTKQVQDYHCIYFGIITSQYAAQRLQLGILKVRYSESEKGLVIPNTVY